MKTSQYIPETSIATPLGTLLAVHFGGLKLLHKSSAERMDHINGPKYVRNTVRDSNGYDSFEIIPTKEPLHFSPLSNSPRPSLCVYKHDLDKRSFFFFFQL